MYDESEIDDMIGAMLVSRPAVMPGANVAAEPGRTMTPSPPRSMKASTVYSVGPYQPGVLSGGGFWSWMSSAESSGMSMTTATSSTTSAGPTSRPRAVPSANGWN